MVRITIRPIAAQFRINMRAAFDRMVPFFQYEHGRAFTENETVTCCIKRTRCFLRLTVKRGERFHCDKTGERQRTDGRFGTACNDNIRITVTNHAQRITNRICPRCAGRHIRNDRTAYIQCNGNLTGRHVGNHHRNRKRTDAGRPPVRKTIRRFFDRGDTTDTGADHRPDPIMVQRVPINLGVFHCHFGRGHTKMSKSIHMTRFFTVHIIGRGKTFDFAGNAHCEIRCIKRSDSFNTRLSCQ